MDTCGRKKTLGLGKFMERIHGMRGKHKARRAARVAGTLDDFKKSMQEAIETAAGCKAVHVNSEPVAVVVRNNLIWKGVVEVFSLNGHGNAVRAYGWRDENGKMACYTTVLEIPPVRSSSTAVRSAMLWEPQKKMEFPA